MGKLVKDEMARNTLWDRFRQKHGPRPGGRGAQECWERQWEQFKKEYGDGKAEG